VNSVLGVQGKSPLKSSKHHSVTLECEVRLSTFMTQRYFSYCYPLFPWTAES